MRSFFTGLFCLLFASFFLSGCYSFTGSSLDPRVKSIQIETFPNYAPLQSATNLSQDFTLSLQDRFDQRTSLLLENSDKADLLLSGEISNYTITPSNITSTNEASQNRLTITVKVIYENKIAPEKSFTKTFSNYADFDANLTITEVEADLIERINSNTIDEIFNAIVSDW